METWIIVTVGAAFLQNIRSSLQKHLKSVMGTAGATFVRFGFGIPFALGFVALLHLGLGKPLPAPSPQFALWVIVAALAQIIAQALLVHMFSYRNFAVGTAYSRTEPAQAALFGFVFLAESLSGGALLAIAIAVAGVMLISVAHMPVNARTLVSSVFSRTALIGLASGMFFGIAAVGYRAASLALAETLAVPDALMQAAVVLGFAIPFQSAVLLCWMLWRDPAELRRVAKAWRIALIVGAVGATASFGWFTAMTLQKAAIVKALAQIEMLFTFASTVFVFRERINRLEIAGCVLICLGVILIVLR